MSTLKNMDEIVSLAKRRGFVFPSSEIYGGIANSWDFGPLGVLLKNNIKNEWMKRFIRERGDVFMIESSIMMNPKVWEATGHVSSFADAMVDCKKCKSRFRADHLIEDKLKMNVEGLSVEDLTKIIRENNIKCQNCGNDELTDARAFNQMFQTYIGPMSESGEKVYLRPETAQGMFVDFKNILNSMRPKLPFGIAQIGKSFRNEITPGNFIFRVLEFEQMEIEYFVYPDFDLGLKTFDAWLNDIRGWYKFLGIKDENIRNREHNDKERSFYSKKTVDVEYNFPMGWKELHGLAYRTDYDLKNHSKFSGESITYFDDEKNEHITPFVVEPAVSIERIFLALLCDAYEREEINDTDSRVVLHLSPLLAPIKVAVLPLMKRDGLDDKAKEIFRSISKEYSAQYDETGSIGKRYRRQDEIGTPICITIDYDTLKDESVTIRDRDSMKQERIKISDIQNKLQRLF